MSNDKKYFKVAYQAEETITWEGVALIEASTLAEAEAVLERNQGALMDRFRDGVNVADGAALSTGDLVSLDDTAVTDDGYLLHGVFALRDGEPVLTHSDSSDFIRLLDELNERQNHN